MICPCGSGKEFADCCEPYILGSLEAPTAEAVMRARYSAFASGNLAYIGKTISPDQRHDFDQKAAEDWAQELQWNGLEIVNTTDGQEEDESGEVEFIARYRQKGQDRELRETSQFKRIEEKWYYVDGYVHPPQQVKREGPKVGRNDPCPCGSGKKYKKCCA